MLSFAYQVFNSTELRFVIDGLTFELELAHVCSLMQRGMRTAALRTDAGSMRQILETLSTHPILSKEPTGRLIAVFPRGRRVSNLPHTSGFNGSTRCVLTC